MASTSGNVETEEGRSRDEGFRRFNRADIRRLVSTMRSRATRLNMMNDDDGLFRLDYVRSIYRFQTNEERAYRLIVNRHGITSLATLLNRLRSVLNYIINVARSLSTSLEDFSRLYFETAPIIPWSTEVVRLKELTVDRIMNDFEKHFQSNLEKVINEGWETNVFITVFPHGYERDVAAIRRHDNYSRRRRRNVTNTSMYRHLNNNPQDSGSGKVSQPLRRKGREVRKGVFPIHCGNLNKHVKGCCFVVAVLVGKSLL